MMGDELLEHEGCRLNQPLILWMCLPSEEARRSLKIEVYSVLGEVKGALGRQSDIDF
jgi:hypothetical protein